MKRDLCLDRRGGCVILCTLLLWPAGGAVPGADEARAGVFAPTESEQQVLWQRIERARADRNWDAVLDGLSRFTELVTRPGLNTVLESGGGISQGIRRVFGGIVASLPAEELVRYQSRVNPLLSALWESSRLRAAPEAHRKLRHLVLRDLNSADIYPSALKEEMEDAFEAGQWFGVRKACEALLALEHAQPSARKPRPEDVLRARIFLAQACAVLGDASAARREQSALRELRGTRTLFESFPEDLREQVEAIAGSTVPDDTAREGRTGEPGVESPLEPAILASGASAGPESSFRLGSVIWERRVSGSRLRSFITERSRMAPGGDAPLPYYPVARGGLIIFQHADRICAYDAGQGREVWSRPLDPAREELSGMRAPLLGAYTCSHVEGRTLSTRDIQDGEILWQRSFAYDHGAKTLRVEDRAQDALDPAAGRGEEVPMEPDAEPADAKPGEAGRADEPEGEPEEEPEPPRAGEEKPGVDAGGAKDRRVGAAKREDGKKKPEGAGANPGKNVAGKGGDGRASVLRPSYSLSPPIRFRDRLAVAVQVRLGQEALHFLACLDASGRVVWTTFLGSAQGGNYLALGGAGSIPLADGETIYHLTNTGILAAVDGEDGTLLWISTYPALSPRGKRDAVRRENRWQPNPILSIGKELFVAPQDSPYLLAVQKATGDIAWRAPRENRSMLVGANDLACLVVGTEASAVAHRGPERGRVLWRFRPGSPSGDNIPALEAAGRPYLARNALLLPTREALICLSPRDGQVLSRTLWDFSGGGGNLLVTRVAPSGSGPSSPATQVLALANSGGILVYSHFAVEKDRIEALPADKTESRLERARFYLKNSELEAGLAVLREWRGTAPPAPSPNSVLDHLHLDLSEIMLQIIRGEGGSPGPSKHAVDLLRFRVELERTPRRKVDAAIELASRLERDGDAAGALKTFHDALAFDNPATDYSPDGVLTVPSATYLRGRIRALRKGTTDAARAFSAVDSTAREALRRAQNKLRTPMAYLEVVRLFPYTQAAAEAYLDLARVFRDSQSYDQASGALDGYLRDYPDGSEAVRVELLAASLLRKSGRAKEARDRYQEILERHASSPVDGVEGARGGETVEEYVKPLLGDPDLARAASEDPVSLRFPVRMAWRSPADLQALKKTFLLPAGSPPDRLRDCFLTQSEDVIELRELETGLPVWKVYLEMVPGFEFDDPGLGRGFRMPRAGRRAFTGRFVASDAAGKPNDAILVLGDERNLFAVDPLKGTVRWHLPIGPEKSPRDPSEPFRPHLREKLRGIAVSSLGIFATTTRDRLLRRDAKGESVWDTKLGYKASTQPLYLFEDRVFVFSQPAGLHVHEVETGEELAPEKLEENLAAVLGEVKESLLRPPIEVGEGQLVLVSASGLKRLDLAEKRVTWKLQRPGTIEEVFHFAKNPDECLVVASSRANRWPALVAVSLEDGRELWRFEKFPPERTSLFVARERNRFYVLHGLHQLKLLALQVRDGFDGDKPIVEPLWPNEVPLGENAGSMAGRLYVGGDSVFFVERDNSISVYDKLQGTSRSTAASGISRFLVEKEDCTSAIIRGKLVILSDGGDCAFEPAIAGSRVPGRIAEHGAAPPGGGSQDPAGLRAAIHELEGDSPPPGATDGTDMELLRQYLENPGALESTSRLALQYFKLGNREAAINVLNRALLSESLLEGNGAEKRYLLSHLLDGIKEENMKERVPRIVSHRFTEAPAIDGDLSDAWDVSSRIQLNSPKELGTIPGPTQIRDWEGEEDLSAVLYTGWDEKYFYFALDVSDDVLYPYDRDAEYWKGDCLIIGLDPTNDQGYQQHGNDQLMTLALTIPKRNKLDKRKDKDGQDQEGDEDEDEGRKPDGLFSVKKKEDDSGAIYEVGLPWKSFSSSVRQGPPPLGLTFGLSLLLTDDDTGQGATKTLSLNPCHLLPRNQKNSPVWRFIIPYFFPKVTLE